MLNIFVVSLYDNCRLIYKGFNNVATEATEKLPNFDNPPLFDTSAGNPCEYPYKFCIARN